MPLSRVKTAIKEKKIVMYQCTGWAKIDCIGLSSYHMD